MAQLSECKKVKFIDSQNKIFTKGKQNTYHFLLMH